MIRQFGSAWVLAVVAVLLPACATKPPRVGAASVTQGDLWAVIEREAKAAAEVEKADPERHPFPGQALSAAVRLADANRLVVLRTLTRDPHIKAWLLGGPATHSEWLVTYVMARAADPTDSVDLQSITLEYPDSGWASLRERALCAAELLHDSDSRDLLLAVGLNDAKPVGERWNSFDPALAGWPGLATAAFGLLRSYPASEVRPLVVAALHRMDQRPAPADPDEARLWRVRRANLEGFLASVDYAETLDWITQARYWDFQRRLWRTWALEMHDAILPDYIFAARKITLRRGDEEFVVRIFETPKSTGAETLIAMGLADQLPEWMAKRLQAVAASTSPNAQYAREALEALIYAHPHSTNPAMTLPASK